MSDNMCEHGGLDGNCLRCKDATIAKLREENERLKAEPHVGRLCFDMTHQDLQQRLAGTEKELEQLRKVVGCMGRGWDYWFISDSDAKANNLDIAALKERK